MYLENVYLIYANFENDCEYEYQSFYDQYFDLIIPITNFTRERFPKKK